MKIQQAKSTLNGGRACRQCKKTVRFGQWYACASTPNAPITDRWFILHVACMKALVADVPDDADKTKESFEALRAQIISTGNLFN